MEEYKEVPYIISTKDLDYLTDMFNWLYGAYKNSLDAINVISDKTLKNGVKTVNNRLYTFMEELLKIMEDHCNEN
jgi:hypothetical protein